MERSTYYQSIYCAMVLFSPPLSIILFAGLRNNPPFSTLQFLAVFCRVLQRVAACCSLLQVVAVCCRVLQSCRTPLISLSCHSLFARVFVCFIFFCALL